MPKIAIMQPYLFPYIGYFQLINDADIFVILDDVNYKKKGWINRNRLYFDDKDYLFTVPIKGASQNRLISELCFDNQKANHTKITATVSQHFRKSRSLNLCNELLDDLFFDLGENNIAQEITKSIKLCCDALNIRSEFHFSSDIDTGNKTGSDRIINICKYFDANKYINLPGGKTLYCEELFRKNGIEIEFINNNTLESTFKDFGFHSILQLFLHYGPSNCTKYLNKE